MEGAAAHNRGLFGRPRIVRKYASLDWLFPAEEAVLDRLSGRLSGYRMLDLGVGGGRTSAHFAPRVSEYQGVDYAPAMVEACRTRFAGALPRAAFSVADARALPPEWSARFDFVLFSYNGLDCVDPGDRPKVLAEIRRVMRPGGWFLFSSHNLNAVADLRSWSRRPGLLPKAKGARDYLVLRLLNPGFDRLLETSECLLRDGGTRWQGRNFHITPRIQIRRLAEAGFAVRDVYPARSGHPFPGTEAAAESRETWIYYLCQPESPD